MAPSDFPFEAERKGLPFATMPRPLPAPPLTSAQRQQAADRWRGAEAARGILEDAIAALPAVSDEVLARIIAGALAKRTNPAHASRVASRIDHFAYMAARETP